MALIMLAFMLAMCRNWKANLAVVIGAIALFGLATRLVRSQATAQEESYMSATIPHHSIAILTREHAEIRDVRVCDLAVGITSGSATGDQRDGVVDPGHRGEWPCCQPKRGRTPAGSDFRGDQQAQLQPGAA